MQVSIGGKALRLHLSNLFNADPTDILGVEIAVAKTMGATPEIDEATTVKLTFDGHPSVTMYPGQSVVSDPVAFPLEDRMNLAITIHYGRISSNHPLRTDLIDPPHEPSGLPDHVLHRRRLHHGLLRANREDGPLVHHQFHRREAAPEERRDRRPG